MTNTNNQFEKYNLLPEKFEFANASVSHDVKLSTKPVGYLKDAWRRFRRNKASVVAACIIVFLLLFAIIVPFCTPFTVSFVDSNFNGALPKSHFAEQTGLDTWDGCKVENMNTILFTYYYAIGVENVRGNYPIKRQEYTVSEDNKTYTVRYDTYRRNGIELQTSMQRDTYFKLQEYQNETGIQVIYPYTESSLRPKSESANGNYWYRTIENERTQVLPDYDENGNFQDIYVPYDGLDQYNSIRIEGDTPRYNYAFYKGEAVEVRVDYYEFFIFKHNYLSNDGIGAPVYLLGANAEGKDILTCLASGARFSFILSILVAGINMFVGAIYGAIEGYYGGATDMVMERIADILVAIPTIIVIPLLRFHTENTSDLTLLFISFFLTGWVGMAGSVRRQFYRFKNQEYVLAARTLGARDRRIMWKHIFPNGLGTIITSSVLMIPSVIFSETSFSYLGIINLETGGLTSIGTMLAHGQDNMTDYPHMIVAPAIFIALLMLSFNLFGNGLRDAFNPSLRGSEG